jgi:hypothetical protein
MSERDDRSEFHTSLDGVAPPDSVCAELQALWWVARGDWERAHRIVQDLDTTAAARVHAYLHRVEGDFDNAGYWYRQAGQPICRDSLQGEWNALVALFDAP